MKIALISEFLPWPLDNAPKIRLYEELKILSQSNEIDLFCFLPINAKSDWVSKIEKLGVNVFAVRMRENRVKKVYQMTKSLFGKNSYYFSKWDDSRLNDVLLRRIKLKSYDLFHIDHTQMASYLPTEHRSRAILVVHNIEHILLSRYAEAAPAVYRPFILREVEQVKSYELSALRDFLKIICMTEHDKSLILSMTDKSANDVFPIPTCVNTEYFKPRGLAKYEYPALIFTGDFRWAPTRDGLVWLLKKVLPKIVTKVPDVKLYVIGAYKQTDYKKFVRKNVIFSGSLDDVRPYLEQSWLFVNPLRVAAGIRTKLLHALSMGLCAVSTTIGFEGLDDALKNFVWCEDSSDEFANRCVELLNDRNLLLEKGVQARQAVTELYGLEKFKSSWLNLYDEIKKRVATSRSKI